jgi:hypothetical protein
MKTLPLYPDRVKKVTAEARTNAPGDWSIEADLAVKRYFIVPRPALFCSGRAAS